MIVYSDTRRNSEFLLPYFEYEVLNELKSVEPRSDSNCLKFTRFLFEFDDMKLEDQVSVLKQRKDLLVRAVYSGSKSIHMIVQFSDEYNEFCKRWYKNIWRWLEHNIFTGSDIKCSNPSRLTRAPGVLRADTGKVQKVIFEYRNNYISNNDRIINALKERESTWIQEEKNQSDDQVRRSIISKFSSMTNHDGMCREYKTVKRYLETPFLKVRGNGNSASWFYAALCCCLQYNDNKTLEEVKDKARREKWTEREIEHTLSNARSAVKK